MGTGISDKGSYLLSVVDASQDGIIAIDSEGVITVFNRAAEEVYGVRSVDAVGRKMAETLDNPGLLAFLADPRSDQVEKRYIGDRVFLTKRKLIQIEDLTRGAVEVSSDITEFETMSQQLRSVKEINQELQAFFDTSWDEIFVTDGEGMTLRVNGACVRICGLKESELVGRNVRDLVGEGVMSRSATLLALEKRKKVTIVEETKSGRRILVTAVLVFDEDRIVRVVNVSRDITELHHLQERFEEAQELLELCRMELSAARKENADRERVVYRSETMERIMALVSRVARVNSTVLLLGESGVGKEVIARTIHERSNCKDGPFIKINCGAIPAALLESELFGYEKGAFTGANSGGKAGLIELADRGTLFLDEIGELPMNLQVKLLQILQDRCLTRVGGVRTIGVDTRVIAATNRDLERMVKKGKFREDLYYRLNVVPINIPPLRERKDDIPLLAHNFLKRFSAKYQTKKELSTEVLDLLSKYYWPGNVRELENLMERLVVIHEEQVIRPHHLPEAVRNASTRDSEGPWGSPAVITEDSDRELGNGQVGGSDSAGERGSTDGLRDNTVPGSQGSPGDAVNLCHIVSWKEATELLERKLITMALHRYGSTHKAAKALGIDQSTVARKVQKYMMRDR